MADWIVGPKFHPLVVNLPSNFAIRKGSYRKGKVAAVCQILTKACVSKTCPRTLGVIRNISGSISFI